MGSYQLIGSQYEGTNTRPRNPMSFHRRVCIVLAALGVFYLVPTITQYSQRLAVPEARSNGTVAQSVDDFRDVLPSTFLQWTPCFDDEYQCARLRLPMDYDRPIMDSSKNPALPGHGRTKSGIPSVSPLLLNPGGPGGSGVSFVLSIGHHLQDIIGDERDIVSFDPRGVGYTTPTTDCFSFPSTGKNETNESDILLGQFNRAQFAISNEAVGLTNSSNAALRQLDAAARAVGQRTRKHERKTRVLWVFIRQEQPPKRRPPRLLTSAPGTLLGATFAALFPDRVGRIVLDGVLDAEVYAAPASSGSIEDADAVFDLFFVYCAEAGAPRCAVARKGDTAAEIRKRVEEDLNNLREQPLVGINPINKTPAIFTWSQVQKVIFMTLYGPIRSFPMLAEIFNALHRVDDQAELLAMPQLHSLFGFQPFCRSGPASSFDSGDAQFSIMCSDKHHSVNATSNELLSYFEELASISTFADVYMDVILGCNGWPVEPAQLPFFQDSIASEAIKTSFPLLFVSNSYDPITPLRSGLKMAQKFDRAGFLEQKGQGHCSVAEVSLCTIAKIRAYYRHGTVPAAPRLGNGGNLRDGIWERCETDEWPWHPLDNSTEAVSRAFADVPTVEVNGEPVLRAWKALQAHMATSGSLMAGPSHMLAADRYAGSSMGHVRSGSQPWR
nr:putative hydrolase [Quercus suber]